MQIKMNKTVHRPNQTLAFEATIMTNATFSLVMVATPHWGPVILV